MPVSYVSAVAGQPDCVSSGQAEGCVEPDDPHAVSKDPSSANSAILGRNESLGRKMMSSDYHAGCFRQARNHGRSITSAIGSDSLG